MKTYTIYNSLGHIVAEGFRTDRNDVIAAYALSVNADAKKLIDAGFTPGTEQMSGFDTVKEAAEYCNNFYSNLDKISKNGKS